MTLEDIEKYESTNKSHNANKSQYKQMLNANKCWMQTNVECKQMLNANKSHNTNKSQYKQKSIQTNVECKQMS